MNETAAAKEESSTSTQKRAEMATLDEYDEEEDEAEDYSKCPRYVVIPCEDPADKTNESEYRGNLMSKDQMDGIPDLELRDLIMKKKFGASPDR